MTLNPLCSFCHREVDPERITTFRKVIGWEHRRGDGGTNALALREPLDEWCCIACMQRLRAGIDPAQSTLM